MELIEEFRIIVFTLHFRKDNDMNSYYFEDKISKTLLGGAAIICVLALLFLIGLLIHLFGILSIIGVGIGLTLFGFLSYWVGKWIVG